MTTATDTPSRVLFDLDEAEPERFRVMHRGEPHYMARTDDLPINVRKRIGQRYERCVALERKDELTVAEETEYDTAIRSIVLAVFPTLDHEAMEKLGAERREALATAFFTSQAVNQILRVLTEAQPSPSTGDASSPDSSATTPSPTPPTGSSASPSAS